MRLEFLRLETTLKKICKDRPVYYMPNPGNWGDGLIYYATKIFFRDIGLDYIEVNPNQPELSPDHQGKCILIYGGGGAWCRYWMRGYERVKALEDFYHNSIILPSTYDGNFNLSSTTFFSRDNYESKKNIPGSLFCHDMAFYLDPIETTAGNGAGYFFREDKEKKPGRPVIEGNIDLSSLQRWQHDVDEYFETLSPYSEIHTDRLHVAIASCLMNKKVYLYEGAYFKNRAVFNSSIQQFYKGVYLCS